MFGVTKFESLIAYEDIQRAGYPLEAEDALAAWEHNTSYEPEWYMKLPANIRHEIEKTNRIMQE